MTIEKALEELEGNERNVRFSRLVTICGVFFEKKSTVGSHYKFKTPWPLDPRINLQEDSKSGGKAKPYQVRQVIQCLKKLSEIRGKQ